MPYAGFEPTIPVSERPQTHALDLTATEIGPCYIISVIVNDLKTFEMITRVGRHAACVGR
jgi:hypothetical protein